MWLILDEQNSVFVEIIQIAKLTSGSDRTRPDKGLQHKKRWTHFSVISKVKLCGNLFEIPGGCSLT
jgi:hypothetical protein